MTKVPDTTKMDPLMMLMEAMLHSKEGRDPSQAIEDQEARGQQDLLSSTQLPVTGSPGHPRMYSMPGECEDESKAWAATGVEFGEAQEGELFRDAKLPEGWKKKRTDHSMHSDLIDDKGRKRAGIFYKAAFYDRKAHMQLERRFHVRQVYKEGEDYDPDDNTVQFEVLDCGKQVFLGPGLEHDPFPGNKDRDKHGAWLDHKEQVTKDAEAPVMAWIEERYPDWKSYASYWDGE